jgi:hypothetical protein
VRVCRDADEIRDAAKYVLSSSTVFGETNTEVLIQSFLHGTEYVVDMVSSGGRRYLAGVWEYRKRMVHGTHNIYDREVLMAPDASPVPELRAYVDQALTALGIDHGPTHAEVMMTPEGPALVEVGARMAGNMQPAFHDLVAGANQADVAALAAVRPEEFLDRWGDRCYTRRRPAQTCMTPTQLDGVVDHVDQATVDRLRALESVFGVDVKLGPQSRIRPTIDLFTSTLRVFMTADEQDLLDHDYQVIQELKDEVYRLE